MVRQAGTILIMQKICRWCKDWAFYMIKGTLCILQSCETSRLTAGVMLYFGYSFILAAKGRVMTYDFR